MNRLTRLMVFILILIPLGAGCRPASPNNPPVGETAAPLDSSQDDPQPVSTPSPVQPTEQGSSIPQIEPAATDWSWVFEEAYNPIQLTVTLDESRVVEALIPVEGGSMTAEATDGTRFNLLIPPDALLAETTIRMTPIASIDGLPWDDSAPHAVRLEPAGLKFNNFVTLKIEPAAPIPADQQILFGFDGENQALSLEMTDPVEPTVHIKLLHFSGYGVSKGLLADTEPIRRRVGGHDEARLRSLAGIMTQGAWIRQRLGVSDPEPNPMEELAKLYKEWDEKVVNPRVAIAAESCAAGRLAIDTMLATERQKQLLGIGDPDALQRLGELMPVISRKCLQEEYELCRDEHIIHRIIPVVLGIERQFQLLGIGSDSGSSFFTEGLAAAKKCLTFDLVFESTGVMDAGQDGGYTSMVKAVVPIKMDDGFHISGQSPLVNESFDFHVPGCSVASERGGGTFEAMRLVYEADTSSPTDPLGHVTDFTLTYYPGQTSESFSVTCDGESFSTPPGAYWTGVFLVLHRGELQLSAAGGDPVPDPSALLGGGPVPSFGGDSGGFVVDEWEILGDEYFAKKEWQKEDTGLGVIEVGTFKLYHRPQP